jgi:DNA-binding NarL/FixJ family response regulator
LVSTRCEPVGEGLEVAQDGLREQLGVLAEASHHSPELTELFSVFAGAVAETLRADLAQILEYDEAGRSFVLRAGWGLPEELYGGARVPAGLLSQAGRALLDPWSRPVVLENRSLHHDYADDPLAVERGARSGIAVKVSYCGRDLGALVAYYRTPRAFCDDEIRFLSRAAGLLASGIVRLEREEEGTAWRSRAELLRAGAALLRVPAAGEALLTASVLAAVAGGAGGSRPIADWCLADALESNGSTPTLKRVAVDHAGGAAEHLREALSSALTSTAPHGSPRAVLARQPELVARTDAGFVATMARDPEHRRAIEEAKPYSYVCAPVMGRERLHGSLGFLRVEGGTPVPYDEGDLAACVEFAALVGAAIDAGLPRPDIQEARDAVRAHASPIEHLPTDPTDREREVLELIAAGHRLTDIERRLHIDYQTVRTHKRHLCQKLGVSTRSPTVSLIAEAKRRGWLAA